MSENINNTEWLNNLSKDQQEYINKYYKVWFTEATTQFHTFKYISKIVFKENMPQSFDEAIKQLEQIQEKEILRLNIALGNSIVVTSDIESTGLHFGKNGRPGTGKIDRMVEYASVFYIRNVDNQIFTAKAKDNKEITFQRFVNPDIDNKVAHEQRVILGKDDLEAQTITHITLPFLKGEEPHSIWGKKIDPAGSLNSFVNEFYDFMSFSKEDPQKVTMLFHNANNFDQPFLDEELSRENPGARLRDVALVADSLPLFQKMFSVDKRKALKKLYPDMPTGKSLDVVIQTAQFFSNVDFEDSNNLLKPEELHYLPEIKPYELASKNKAYKEALDRLNSTERTVHGALVDSQMLGDALIVLESIFYPSPKKVSMSKIHDRDNTQHSINSYQPIFQTEYSGNGVYGKPEDYVKHYAEMTSNIDGEKSMVLADRFSVGGKVAFFKSCQAHNVRPILGMEVDLLSGATKKTDSVVLIANNEDGEKNLNRIGSLGFDAGKSGYEVVNVKDLNQKLTKDLSVVISGSLDAAILEDDKKMISSIIAEAKSLFGDNVFIGVSHIASDELEAEKEDFLHKAKIELSKKFGIPLYAENKVKFPKEGDYEAQQMISQISESTEIYSPHLKATATQYQYLASPEQMTSKFSESLGALSAPIEHFKNTQFAPVLGKPSLPKFELPEGVSTESEYLRLLTREGFEKKWPMVLSNLERLKELGQYDEYMSNLIESNGWEFDPKKSDIENLKERYFARLEEEFTTIDATNFPGYFLLKYETLVVKGKRELKMPIGSGRGSAPGSLVLWSLDISTPDPIEYGLLFERFLNPERIGMPDIDSDISQARRPELIKTIKDQFGENKVCQITTNTTLAAKASIDSVTRVYGYKPYESKRFRQIIPEIPGIKLSDEMESNPQLTKIAANPNKQMTSKMLDMAVTMEGVFNGKGKHAGGVVIFQNSTEDHTPIFRPEDDQQALTTQLDKDDVEDVGGVKYDYLGLKNLDIINKVCLAEGITDEELEKDRVQDSRDAINLIKRGDVYGVFQLESPGMQKLIQGLDPDSFKDVVSLLALYRPGPLESGMTQKLVDSKSGKIAITYPHEKLEKLLAPTYGTIIYQEQVMKAAQILAGFTLGQADTLRKAMGKKKPEVIEQQRKVFVDGAMNVSRKDILESSKTANTNAIDINLSDIDIPNLKSNLSEMGYFDSADSAMAYLQSEGVISDDEKEKMARQFDPAKYDAKKDTQTFENKRDFYEIHGKTIASRLENKFKESGVYVGEERAISTRIVVAISNMARYNQFFNTVAEFAAYGFNQSHSVAYAFTTMKTAHLKANYPAQFMAAVATFNGNIESVSKTLLEARRMGLKISPPSVNKSEMEFTNPSGDKQNEIQYGFGSVLSLRETMASMIIEEREKNGKYENYLDFVARISQLKTVADPSKPKAKPSNILKVTQMKILLASGALDEFIDKSEVANVSYGRNQIRNTFPLVELLSDPKVIENPELITFVRNSIALLTHSKSQIASNITAIEKTQELFKKYTSSAVKLKKADKEAVDSMGFLFDRSSPLTLDALMELRVELQQAKTLPGNKKNMPTQDEIEELDSIYDFKHTGMYSSNHILNTSGEKKYLKSIRGFDMTIDQARENVIEEGISKPRGKENVKSFVMGRIAQQYVSTYDADLHKVKIEMGEYLKGLDTSFPINDFVLGLFNRPQLLIKLNQSKRFETQKEMVVGVLKEKYPTPDELAKQFNVQPRENQYGEVAHIVVGIINGSGMDLSQSVVLNMLVEDGSESLVNVRFNLTKSIPKELHSQFLEKVGEQDSCGFEGNMSQGFSDVSPMMMFGDKLYSRKINDMLLKNIIEKHFPKKKGEEPGFAYTRAKKELSTIFKIPVANLAELSTASLLDFYENGTRSKKSYGNNRQSTKRVFEEATSKQVNLINILLKDIDMDLDEFFDSFGIKNMQELSKEQAIAWISEVKKSLEGNFKKKSRHP